MNMVKGCFLALVLFMAVLIVQAGCSKKSEETTAPSAGFSATINGSKF